MEKLKSVVDSGLLEYYPGGFDFLPKNAKLNVPADENRLRAV